VPKIETKHKRIKGFTHYSVSGTGFIKLFYNFYMVSFTNGKKLPKYEKIVSETASPGEYTVSTEKFTASAVITRDTVCYKIHFNKAKGNRIVINPAYGGLDLEKPKPEYALRLETALTGKKLSTCSSYAGIELYAEANLDGFERVYEFEDDGVKYIAAELPKGASEAEFKIAFSFTSGLKAKKYLESCTQKYPQIKESAKEAWMQALSIIDVEGGEKEKRLFYTCLYNAQKKPVDISHENFLTSSDTMYTEIATMWDMYKTALPFMALMHPEKYRDFINGLLSIAEGREGRFPVCVLFERYLDRNAIQARSLAHSLILTAHSYKIEGIDYRRALGLMVRDLERTDLTDIRNTHLLDMADASCYTAQLAGSLGELGIYERFIKKSKIWLEAFDKSTGMLRHGDDVLYYEGTYWNYSFRLSPYIEDRIALCGEQKFGKLLDHFFGFSRTKIKQYRKPTPDFILGKYADSHPSFEGINNEPDMETPFNYAFINRHSRVSEIVRSAMYSCYDDTAAGLPGNDDSGALCSWYVFNAVGLFPMAGSDIFFIGSPVMEKATLHLKNDFTVLTHSNSKENIYVEKALLNGNKLDRLYIFHSEIAAGGTLELFMTADREKSIKSVNEGKV
jgi:putative alpha-1,2-mannosidase